MAAVVGEMTCLTITWGSYNMGCRTAIKGSVGIMTDGAACNMGFTRSGKWCGAAWMTAVTAIIKSCLDLADMGVRSMKRVGCIMVWMADQAI